MEENRFEKGGIREMLYIAFPMLVSNSCETVMVFTDRLFLSRLGSVQMSAAMSGGMGSFMLVTLFMGLIGYTTAMVAQNLGAGRYGRCPLVTTQALILTAGAYPVILALRPLINSLMNSSGIDPQELYYQTQYFNILVFGSVLIIVRICFSSFFSGIGRTKIVMLSSVGAMLVNIPVSWVLIFGRCGFPAMGIKGAAAGTITGSAFGILILLLAYFSGANRRNFSVMDSFRLDWNIMKSIFRFGTPAGLEFFLSFTAFYALILIFHAGGPVSAAASTIVFNWDHVSFVPLLGIEIAVTSLVGRYVGAGDMDTVYKTVKSGIKTGWAYSVLIFVLFVFFPASLTDFFKPSPPDDIFINARPLSIFMIQVAAVYVIVEAQMVVLAGALRGAGDTFVTMLITVSLHWILVLILYVVMFPLGFGPKAGWAVVVLLFLMFPLLLYFRFRSGKWKNIKID